MLRVWLRPVQYPPMLAPNALTANRRIALLLMVALLIGLALICAYDMSHTPPGVPSDAMLDVSDGLRISRGVPFPADFTDRPEMPYRVLLAGWFILLGPSIFAALVNQIFVELI